MLKSLLYAFYETSNARSASVSRIDSPYAYHITLLARPRDAVRHRLFFASPPPSSALSPSPIDRSFVSSSAAGMDPSQTW